MVTGSGIYQGMFQNLIHELVDFPDGQKIIPVVKLSNDSITREGGATINSAIIAPLPNGSVEVVGASINKQLNVQIGDIQADAGSRVRVSQITTLGDYKLIGHNHSLLVEEYGNGSGTYSQNKYLMTVDADQYKGLNSLRPHQYFSGKSQLIEATFDNFAPETGTVKRVGYYSNQSTGTYDSLTDGIRLESNGNSGTVYLQAWRSGVETLCVPLEQWDGYGYLGDYQNLSTWDNFTVVVVDFLWLGGAIKRLWVKTEHGFVLAHVFHYSGSSQDTFIESPNQPLRYELRSLGGTGSFRYVCSQVATEGSVGESGETRSHDTGLSLISLANQGTTYPIKAIRKKSSMKNNCARLEDVSVFVASLDTVLWSIQINPTLSAPLTYTDVPNSCLQQANGNGTITVTSPGTIIASGYLTQNTPIPNVAMIENFLSWLGGNINGTQQEYVVCIGCVTTNVNAGATMLTKEY